LTIRFTQFPRDLAFRAKSTRIGDIPTLLAHPDWEQPAPFCLWLHGRTANKELDPGRYLRWVRAGMGVVAIDLPGHGERADLALQQPDRSLDVLAQAITEVDRVVAAIRESEYQSFFDFSRAAIGGMSLGGMAALRRLCDPHPFRAAAVEGTTGWLEGLYFPGDHGLPPWTRNPPDDFRPLVAVLSAAAHLETFAPIPLLALHSEADEMLPFNVQRTFIERLREHYRAEGADPSLIEFHHWPKTGAPQEHVGFGMMSNDAKNMQTEFFSRVLTS
jgi:fermentation-respiration switch protein FrsA (DUF1100 family)